MYFLHSRLALRSTCQHFTMFGGHFQQCTESEILGVSEEGARCPWVGNSRKASWREWLLGRAIKVGWVGGDL